MPELRKRWKLVSWPFKKIDEQRTSSFNALVTELKTDIDGKFTDIAKTSEENSKNLEKRFDAIDDKFVEMDGKLSSLVDDQTKTQEQLDALAAARIKNHVLNFARQCRKGEQHSHEDFANLFRDHKIYSALVTRYGWDNDVYTHDFDYITHNLGKIYNDAINYLVVTYQIDGDIAIKIKKFMMNVILKVVS